MTPELQARLKHCTSLPSIPSVAIKILDLSKNPDVCPEDVSAVVRLDPALSAKLLRIANSPIYSRISKIGSIQQALTLLGVDASLNLALSFSLVSGLQQQLQHSGIDFDLVWRRSFISAVASRLLGETLKLGSLEELFLAGLLQDIGVLALDRVLPDQYPGIFNGASDLQAITSNEQAQLQATHAEVGAWLLNEWNLSKVLVSATRASHGGDRRTGESEGRLFNDCVMVSGLVADIWLNEQHGEYYQRALEEAQSRLGFDPDTFVEYLSRLSELIPDTAALFETELAWPGQSEMILEQAKEMHLVRSIRDSQKLDTEDAQLKKMEERAQNLEEKVRRDSLTGLYNRGYLDLYLEAEFERAIKTKTPLSIVLIDLDFFKQVNDTYGHPVGDRVLQSFSELLGNNIRNCDTAARYGGEEFAMVLPGIAGSNASAIIARLLENWSGQSHRSEEHEKFGVTASAGLATLDFDQAFSDVSSMISAADKALYSAKQNGRNRLEIYAGMPR